MALDADEREIFYYLKSWKIQSISPREICRRASGKSRFREFPDWAKPLLVRMVEKGILETDASGYYRIRPVPRKDKRSKWVSPQLAKILEESGKDFKDVITVDDDAYYENL